MSTPARAILYRSWSPPPSLPPAPLSLKPAAPSSPSLPSVAPSLTDSDSPSELFELSGSSAGDLPTAGPSSPSSSPPSSSPNSPFQPLNGPSYSSPAYDGPYQPYAAAASFFPFFEGVLTLDPIGRTAALSDIRLTLLPPSSPPSPLLATHFPSLIRLALEAPFKDVREGFIELLAHIADADERYTSVLPASAGASRLVPDHLLPPMSPPTPPTILSPSSRSASPDAVDYSASSELLEDLFLSTGRIPHFDRLLSFHPAWYGKWEATLDFLLSEPAGPLLMADRHYIAMIGASRFSSPYFLSYHSSLFLAHQGDQQWLTSIAHAPRHLQALSALSTRLAYSPYALRPSDIDRALKEGAMSLAELVHALAILTTFHAASAFAAALQINEEVDLGPLVQRVRGSPSTSRPGSRRNSLAGEPPAPVVATRRDSKGDIVSEAQFLRRVLSDGHLQAEEVAAVQADAIEDAIFPETRSITLDELYKPVSSPGHPQPQAGARALCPTAERFYVDGEEVAKGPAAFLPSPATPLFSFSSFTFHEHAAMALGRYYAPAFSQLLLDEMGHLARMTTGSIGRSDGWDKMDTAPFRRAIQLYVERYTGVYRDDFNYTHIATLLSKPLQTFIVRVCEGVPMTAEEWGLPGFELTEAEKVHIALIVMEARRQAELLYALHALVALNE